MDLQEKLNEIDKEANDLVHEIEAKKERLSELTKLAKQYLKLIEKAKALEK